MNKIIDILSNRMFFSEICRYLLKIELLFNANFLTML